MGMEAFCLNGLGLIQPFAELIVALGICVLSIVYQATASAVEVPATMPPVCPASVNPAALPGRYAGMLVTYDWSGRHIISERPLTVDMTAHGDTLGGKWCHGGDTVRFEAVASPGGRLRFTRGAVRQRERYTDEGKVLYRFKYADLAVSGGCLAGPLRLYSVTYQEPERPMYVCMRKVSTAMSADSTGASRLAAYPNPFSGQVTVEIDLPEAVAGATVAMFSQSGMNVYSAKLGSLQAGKQTFTVAPPVPDGVYVLTVTAGGERWQTIVIKRRGVQ